MICKNCGKTIPNKARTCPFCGQDTASPPAPSSDAPQFCAECGAPLREGANFCRKCGAKVPSAVPSAADDTRQGVVIPVDGPVESVTVSDRMPSQPSSDRILSEIIARLKDMDCDASPVKGEITLPTSDAQSMFFKYLRKILSVTVVILSLALIARPLTVSAKSWCSDPDPSVRNAVEDSGYTELFSRDSTMQYPVTEYWADAGLGVLNRDDVAEFAGKPFWMLDIICYAHRTNLELGLRKFGSDADWRLKQEGAPKEGSNSVDFTYTATCRVGDTIQIAGIDWRMVTAYALGTHTDWSPDYSINSKYWKPDYDSEPTERALIRSNVRAVRYDGGWAQDAEDYVWEPESHQTHVSMWEYTVEAGDEVIYADVDLRTVCDLEEYLDDAGSCEYRMRVKFLVEDSDYGRAGGPLDPGGNGGEEEEEEQGNHFWEYDTDADETPGTETGLSIPAVAVAVIGGFVLIKVITGKGKKGGKGKGKGSGKDSKVQKNTSVQRELAPSEKLQQQREEGNDPNNYAMRLYKDFGDTLVPGGDPQPVYARIVRIDPAGNVTNETALTKRIRITSPSYLKITDNQMSGEYMAARVAAPLVRGGSMPDSAVVEFTMEEYGAKLTNRVHFKVDNSNIEFLQENLGLPAHYEEEVRLLFCVHNMPQDAEVTAVITGSAKPAYSVSVEQDSEVPSFYYAVIRDILPDDVHDPGYTQTWELHISARSESSKIEKSADFYIYRIFMGLSFWLEANAVGCYLDGKQPAKTMGRLLLLEWDEEEHEILRIAPTLKQENSSQSVTALRIEYDRTAAQGAATVDTQRVVDQVGVKVIPTDDADNDGARIVEVCSTTAALDRPTRLRARISVTVRRGEHEYTASKEVLLHSMPPREWSPENEKEDAHILDYLLSVQKHIYANYMDRLFSLYNLIDRMIDGYDPLFGYDANQYENVKRIWVAFRRGEFAGANAEAEGVTLADELHAYYALLQGMRDNGGVLGRIALGVCTAGYSEHVFFAMDLYEKMEEKVMSCRDGEEFGFWDGVVLGVKEYELSVAQEMLIGGALKGANTAVGKLSGVDLGKTIRMNYANAMKSADSSLKASSKTYAAASGAMDKLGSFLNGSARSLSDAQKSSQNARSAARERIDAKTNQLKDLSIAERRNGAYGADEWRQDVINNQSMNKIRKLDKIRGEIRRGSPDYWQKKQEYEDLVYDIICDPNAKKQLKALDGPAGLTNRAEFNRVRQQINASIQEKFLDNVSERTGRPRSELYIQNVTSNKAADELAGKSVSEDLDVTAAQEVYSEKGQDVVIGQTVGEEELAKAVYETRYGRKPATAAELAEAKNLCREMDVTYVSPGGDYGYVGEHNPEAYFDLSGMLDKSQYGRALKSPAMDQNTVLHKGTEWYQRGDAYAKEAQAIEDEIGSGLVQGEELKLKYQQAAELEYKASGCYVEGTRQITKTVNNIADPRNAYAVSRGESDVFTPELRDLQELASRVGSRQTGEISPEQFKLILQSDYHTDLYGFASAMSKTFR